MEQENFSDFIGYKIIATAKLVGFVKFQLNLMKIKGQFFSQQDSIYSNRLRTLMYSQTILSQISKLQPVMDPVNCLVTQQASSRLKS